MTTLDTRNARLLMCRPEHFAVSYAINPWMDPTSWARDNRAHAAAAREWADLHRTLTELGADIDLVPSVPGLPDLVFTANAAVVLDRQVLLARFRHPERRREEVHFEAAFRSLQARGVVDAVRKLPDARRARRRRRLRLGRDPQAVLDGIWPAVGCRRAARGRGHVRPGRGRARACGSSASITWTRRSPRSRAARSCICPMPSPRPGRAAIRARVAPEQRIEIGSEDGCRLAANAVCLGNAVVMSGCGERLRAELAERGYRVVTTPLPSFLRSGGSAFCLTLRLDRRSVAAAATPDRAAVA